MKMMARAHLHSPLARAVFVTIDGKVYKLLKAMYGLRDAGAAFDRKVHDVMNLMGVSLGKFSICVGYRKAHVICRDEWTMRASYLSQDRCELQFAVKELARRMQQPNTKNMQALKRLVRFLKGSPRCLVMYNRQPEQPIVDVFSDSDWAGCTKTRRSTSSSYVMLGGHLFATSATTQNVVATSSGEAECYALSKSASRALGAVAAAMEKVFKTTCT